MISMSRWRSWGFNIASIAARESILEPPDFEQTADVTRLSHRRADPGLNDPDRRVRSADQRRAQRHDVGAVVLARVARDRLVLAHRRPDPADLVRRDRRSDAGAVDDD